LFAGWEKIKLRLLKTEKESSIPNHVPVGYASQESRIRIAYAAFNNWLQQAHILKTGGDNFYLHGNKALENRSGQI